jgi:hypothetical protein
MEVQEVNSSLLSTNLLTSWEAPEDPANLSAHDLDGPTWTDSMNIKDYIGKRGETIFKALITKWCGGRPWFDDVFLGEKAEARDYLVNLIDPSVIASLFYVQVKSTSKGYSGKGADKKLNVSVSKEDVRKLKQTAGPTYICGIDIVKGCGFLYAVTKTTRGPISGLPTRFRINCQLIRKLWKEVDDYWKNREMLPGTSQFSC